MAAIFSFLKLCQNRRHRIGAECDKEPFGENRFPKSLFVNEIENLASVMPKIFGNYSCKDSKKQHFSCSKL